MSNFMKIRLVADELFHTAIRKADGQTDMMKIIVAFCNFGKAIIISVHAFHVLGCLAYKTKNTTNSAVRTTITKLHWPVIS